MVDALIKSTSRKTSAVDGGEPRYGVDGFEHSSQASLCRSSPRKYANENMCMLLSRCKKLRGYTIQNRPSQVCRPAKILAAHVRSGALTCPESYVYDSI